MATLDQFKSQIDLLSLDINNLDDNARAELLKHLAQKIGSLSQKKESKTQAIIPERDEIDQRTVIKKEIVNEVIKKEFSDEAESTQAYLHHNKKETREDNSKDACLAKLYNGKLPTCKECKESFRSLGALDDHMGTVHMEKEKSKNDNQTSTTPEQNKIGKLECKECDKLFENFKNLRRHSIIHTDKFKCKNCGKRCLQASDLVIHNKNPLSCKKYLDSLKRTNGEKDKMNKTKSDKDQQPRVENEETNKSTGVDPLPRLRHRSTRAKNKFVKEEKKEEYPRLRRLMPKPNDINEVEGFNTEQQQKPRVMPQRGVKIETQKDSFEDVATTNSSESINIPKKEDSKSELSLKDNQFCRLCNIKVGGNSNNFKLHVGGTVHQELTLQEELGIDPRQLLCRVCQKPSTSYKTFQNHLRKHPGGAVTVEASETLNEDEKKNVDSRELNPSANEEIVISKKALLDDSEPGNMIESEVNEDSFEANSDDEPCSEESSEDEKLMESDDDAEESKNEMVDDKVIESMEKEKSLMESENMTEGDEDDSHMFDVSDDQLMPRISQENEKEEGREIQSDQTLDSNEDGGSDESEIELDDAELLDDEEIEEFQNQNNSVTTNESEEDHEEFDDFTDLEQETTRGNVDDMEIDEDEDQEEMRQCEQCHKYFPDEAMLTDHLRTHVKKGEEEDDPSRTVVKEEDNNYRSSLIPDFILDTLR